MLIVCPACASRYRVDAAMIGAAGKTVRCGACRTDWFVAPEVAPATEPDAPEPEDHADDAEAAADPTPAATDGDAAETGPDAAETAPPPASTPQARPSRAPRLRPPARRTGGSAPALTALAATLALLVGFVWQREAVVRLIPSYAPLYAAIGLPVNLRGVAFGAVTARLVETGRERYLIVEGAVINPGRVARAAPTLRIELRDDAGTTVYRWTATPAATSVEAGAGATFRTRIASPPVSGRRVLVRVAPGPDAPPA